MVLLPNVAIIILISPSRSGSDYDASLDSPFDLDSEDSSSRAGSESDPGSNVPARPIPIDPLGTLTLEEVSIIAYLRSNTVIPEVISDPSPRRKRKSYRTRVGNGHDYTGCVSLKRARSIGKPARGSRNLRIIKAVEDVTACCAPDVLLDELVAYRSNFRSLSRGKQNSHVRSAIAMRDARFQMSSFSLPFAGDGRVKAPRNNLTFVDIGPQKRDLCCSCICAYHGIGRTKLFRLQRERKFSDIGLSSCSSIEVFKQPSPRVDMPLQWVRTNVSQFGDPMPNSDVVQMPHSRLL